LLSRPPERRQDDNAREVVELELEGEVAATGDAYRLPCIQVFRVRDGAIVSFRDDFGPRTAEALAAAFPG
jgi:uncharacterized protein